ncbi:serine/threonine-protein kinase ZRK1-like [Solanum verrucosum]|nr:serine/threonine-protein kinase ZRK1-like [Solanum verrucosum]
MVYEYVESITLSDLLYKKGDHKTRESLSWGKRLRIANEVASAIVFLHTGFTTPIIHRDIKPHKVIIDQNSGVAKIVDFSLSISLPPGELEVQDGILCGTFWYLDPECASLGIVTQKTDVYSFGVLLLQLLTGNKSLDSMQSNIEEGNAMDRVNSTIFKDPNLPTMVELYIKERDVIDIADPTLLERHGVEIRQQLEDYLDLVKRCISSKGEDRPYMIHVARELHRIENCFRALTIGQI